MAKRTKQRRKRRTASADFPDDIWRYQGDIEEVVWPALGGPNSTLNTNVLLAVFYQLQRSQWSDLVDLKSATFEQLRALLEHASANAHYGRRFDTAGLDIRRAITETEWQRLPLQLPLDLGELVATALLEAPASHGGDLAVHWASESATVPFVRPMITALVDAALLLREFDWHDRNPSELILRVCALAERNAQTIKVRDGFDLAMRSTASPATRICIEAGVGPATIVAQLLDSSVAILECATETLVGLLEAWDESNAMNIEPSLRLVRCHGSYPDNSLREHCRTRTGASLRYHFDLPLTGVIAVECPEVGALHVQSEHVYVEIVDADTGIQVPPGRSGRVLVTDLHNFRLPLLRLMTNWQARFGEPCACGRGLPVLTDLTEADVMRPGGAR